METIEKFFGNVITIISAIFDFVLSLLPEERKREFTADFGSASSVLSRFNHGFVLDGKRALDVKSSFQHAIIFGKTGQGKSATILLPTIYNMIGKCSLIINDPGGNLYAESSGRAHQVGSNVMVLNYERPQYCGYNPLKRARTISDCQKISKLLITTALGKSKDPFWNIAAEGLLTVMIRLVQYQPEDKRNLGNVLLLVSTLSYDPQKIDRLCITTGDATLIAEYKSYVAYDPKMLMSIIATCRAALSIFNDPQVARCTSYDSINFDDFRSSEMPITLYITNSIPDMKYYSVLTSLFMEQCWAHIMSRIVSRDEMGVFFLCDEASSLTLNLQITISNLRKYNSGMMLVYQSAAQLNSLFSDGDAKAIEENVFARLYLPAQDISVANKLEQTFGKYEYTDEKEIRRVMPLLSAADIRMSDKAFLICSNLAPMQVTLCPYFEQVSLRSFAKIPPYQPPSVLPFDTPPFIQFDNK